MIQAAWPTVVLGDVGRFQAGSAFPRDEQGSSQGDVPFIKVSDMNLPSNSKKIHTANNWITHETALRMKAKLVPAGAVVFAKIGEALKAERLREITRPTVIDNNMMAAVAKSTVDSVFLRLLLEHVHLADWAGGSALPFLRQGDLVKVPILLPHLVEQRGIAATLSALDDKIESNRRVRLLAWELLSAEYEQLTHGSDEVELRALLNLEYGKSLPGAVRAVGSVPVYGSNGVTGAHDRALISGPGVVVGRKGSIGEVHWSHVPSFPIDTTFYAVPEAGYPMLACYFALKSAGLMSKNSDSAVPGLNRDAAHRSRVLAPNARASREWANGRASLLDYLHHCDREIARLNATREKLLPALLSGRLRVREAEDVLA